MIIELPHRFYMAFMAIAIFIFGIFIGDYVVENPRIVTTDAILMGLAFTSIITLLIVSSFILQIKEILENKKDKK
ncbi:MAG: hypothetical protein QGI89_05380 [Candidatus Woesearchaeota archaeon]|jgi:hypothetical protein|nr:hypothetical protein [Candidatus Woesearchaeota archaeon]|tara:strand:- start:113 stop:337 length:225 start_codon:yes stop_codon:yes gene_type:complete